MRQVKRHTDRPPKREMANVSIVDGLKIESSQISLHLVNNSGNRTP